MVKITGLFLVLALLVVIPFLIWGDALESALLALDAGGWKSRFGVWAWAVGLLLLIADLVLPIPATAVMTALGILYGPLIGGSIAALGSFLAGSLGYLVCRRFGRPAAAWFLGEQDLCRGERLFAQFGGWFVALSRWLPVFPEVVACMAGLTSMPKASFFAALACGSIPFGFAFAALGHVGVDQPLIAISISLLFPPLLWLAAQAWLRGRQALTS
ncbi:MAG: VTT domain-containing protein [Pseudomonadota bacterium]